MKNKKGFTLIEIIGAVIILGIIALIAFNTFLGNLKGFRDDYYNNIVRTLSESGKEFFNDNRNYRPGGILGAQKVSLGMLESKGYLDEVVDYKGKVCDKTNSYVLVVKEGKDDYSYHTCLKCVEDGFDNTTDSYCDPAWLDPTTITYGIGDPPEIYVYLGTSRERLKELLEVPVSYVRTNSAGEVLRSVRGTPEEGLPTILPDNIDVVDTNKLGEYEVTYKFKTVRSGVETGEVEISPGKVTVYENDAPGLAITYRDVVASTGATLAEIKSGGATTNTGIYASDTWHQNITVTLTSPTFIDPEATVSRYQWNKDGRWQDFCTTNGLCQVVLSKDMNETIQFRVVDTNGHISRLTSPIVIKRDNTSPYCELKISGTIGNDEWYITDVDIEFAENKDLNSGTYAEAVSGIILNNLDKAGTTLNRSESSTTITHTENTPSVTYIGYAEDRAGNYTTCDVTFKKDDNVPEISITATRKGNGNTVPTNTWVNDGLNFKLTAGTTGVSSYTIYYCKDTTNTCTPTTSVGNNELITTYNNVVGEYYIRYKIVSGSGMESEVGSYHAKVDITKPTCSLAVTSGTPGTNPWYTSASMTVTATFNDTGGSNVNQTGTIDSATPTYNSLTTYTLSTNENGKIVYCYVTDVAGNVNSNSITLYKDDVTPTVSLSATKKTSGTEVATNTWSNEGLNFKLTAGTTGVSSYTIYYCKDTANSCNPTTSVSSGSSITTYNSTLGEYYIRYKIVSGAGLENEVESYHAKVDTTKPTCTISSSNTNWTNQDITLTVSGSDTGGSGLPTNKYSWVGSPYNFSSTATSTASSNGTYKAYIIDVAGNIGDCSYSVTNIDKVDPTCSLSVTDGTLGSDGWYKSNSVTLTSSFDDNASGVLNKGTTTSSTVTYNGETTYTITSNTTGITIYCYAKDRAGNTGSNSKTIKKDDGVTGITCSPTGGNSSWRMLSQVDYGYKATGSVSGCVDYSGSTETINSSCEYSTWVSIANGSEMTTKTDGPKYLTTKSGARIKCEQHTFDIYADVKKPTCSITASTTSLTNGDVTLTVYGADTGSGLNTTSPYSWTSSTSGFSSTTTNRVSSNGTYTAYVKDAVGNVGSCTYTVTNIDKTPPTCNLSITEGTLGSNGWYKSLPVTVTATFSDEGGSGVGNTGTTTSSTASYNEQSTYKITSNTTGITVYCYVKDKVGNTGYNSKTIKVDNGAGSSCTTSGGNSSWINADRVTIRGGLSITPISGCQEWDEGNSSVSSNCIYSSYVNISSGEEKITYSDGSNGGFSFITNSGVTIMCRNNTWNIYSDRKNPTCSISANITSPTNGNVILTVTGTDTGSGVNSYSWDGTTYNSTRTRTVSSSQTYTAYVKDAVGNVGSCSYTVSNIDKTPPTCSFNYNPAPPAWTNNVLGVRVTINRNDNLTPSNRILIHYNQAGTSGSTYTWNQEYWDNTAQAYEVRVEDEAGNIGSCYLNVTNVDRTPPTCQITAEPASWAQSVKLTVVGSDSQSGIANPGYRWGGVEYTNTTSKTFTTESTSTSGSRETVGVVDNAGNGGSCTGTYFVDRTGPTCLANGSLAGDKKSMTVTINSSDALSGLGSYPYSWTSSSSGFVASNSKTFTTNGTKYYYVKDNAGNVATCTYTVTGIVINCSAGTYLSSGSCLACPAGHYCTGGSNKTECPVGTYRTTVGGASSSDCTPCPAGYKATASTGQSSLSGACEICPRGLYCTGGTNLDYCPNGTYGRDTGLTSASECTPCPYPKVGNGIQGATTEEAACKTCSSGTYYNSGVCSDCPAGYYCTGSTNKTACPAGTFRASTKGKRESDCSTCSAGTYSTGGATSCSTCTAGYYCPGGTRIQCPSGYSSLSGKSSQDDCRVWVAAGYYKKSSTGSDKSCCIRGYYSSGHYSYYGSEDKCSKCSAGQTTSSTCSTSSSACVTTGGSCFLPGTPVMTSKGFKAIEKITSDDYVLSFNEKTQENEYKKVIKLLIHENQKEVLYTLTIDDFELQVTQDHRFYIERADYFEIFKRQEYIAAKDLRIGDKVRYSDGSFHKIKNISYITIEDTVYNLEIEDNHNYYVSEKEILVHNQKVEE